MVLLADIRIDGRVQKEIRTLVAAGHDVELVVADFTKNGSDDAGLGIPIHYIPQVLWSQPAMNFIEQLLFNRKAASILEAIRPTHIHCHDLTTLLAGTWAKNRIGATLIFDAHELMPESMEGIRESVWGNIERRLIQKCDHVIIPEINRIHYFKNKYPNTPEPLLLENFPRRVDMPTTNDDIFRKIYPISAATKIILHIGPVRASRYVDELVESMQVCSDAYALIILGRPYQNSTDAVRKKIRRLGLEDCVFLHDEVPHTEILRYMMSCDIGTVFYRNTNMNCYYCASNKLYEYIALKKSILTNNYPGLLKVMGDYNNGVCLEEVTAQSLAEAYTRCTPSDKLSEPTNYFWEAEEHVLVSLYGNTV
jgi:glycosyltransferase involved in cell wall biosynthesis